MKTLVLTILFSLLLYGCNQENSKILSKATAQSEQHFFDYDAIDYYVLPSRINNVGELYSHQTRSDEDAIKFGVLIGDIPHDINDVKFIQHLQNMGFKKSKIVQSQFQQFDQIFQAQPHIAGYANACIPEYRDILIFKKNDQISGMVKLCFDCGRYRIVGNRTSTENFGYHDEFRKLYKLLGHN